MKKKRFIYFLVAFGLITFIVYFFLTITLNSKDALKQMSVDSISLKTMYSTEYAKELNLPKDLVFKGAIYSKTREPIEKFEDKNAYYILYRLPVKNDKPLPKIIHIKNKSIARDNLGYYELTDDFAFKEHSSYNILYKPGIPKSGTEIDLTLTTSDFRILKNTDSLYSCYAQIGSFGMVYGDNDNSDIFGELKPGANFESLPVQFDFKKAGNHYYCLLIIEKK